MRSQGLSIPQGLDRPLNSKTVKEMKSKEPAIHEGGNHRQESEGEETEFYFGHGACEALKFFSRETVW